jgi:hypothetical protein
MASFGFGDLGGVMKTWLSSGLFWFVIAVVLTIGVFIILSVNKRRRLKWNVLELLSYGNGKVGINLLTAGIFKKKSTIFGLWDYGNENVIKCNDGRLILEGSLGDLMDIMGRKGFMVRRKDDDPKILVPVNRISWKGENALFEITPADFRDASVNIIDTANRETQSWADKYLPYIMLGGMVIFFIVGFILASQFFNRTVDKAGEILIKVASNAGSVQQSTTAP